MPEPTSQERQHIDTLRAHVRQNTRLRLETTIVSTEALRSLLRVWDALCGAPGVTVEALEVAREVEAAEGSGEDG